MTVLAGRLTAIGDEPPTGEKPSPSPPADAVFRLEGEYWTIGLAATISSCATRKGCGTSRYCLHNPDANSLPSTWRARRPMPNIRSDQLGDAGSQLDVGAKAAYRARLHELQEELDDAQAANDTERAEKARQEMDFLGSRARRAPSDWAAVTEPPAQPASEPGRV